MVYGCRRLDVTCSCCLLGTMFVCHYRGVTFICVKVMQTSKVYPISDKKSNQWSSICGKTRVMGILVTIVISYV